MNPTKTSAQELVVYQYLFLADCLAEAGGEKHSFLADSLHEPGEEKPPGLVDYLKRLLKRQNEWLHGPGHNGETTPLLCLSMDAKEGEWVYPVNGSIEWAEGGDKRVGFTAARRFGGAICLLQGVGQREANFWNDSFRGIFQAAESLSGDGHFLGATVCCGAIVADEKEARLFAEQVLGDGSKQHAMVRTVEVLFGWLFDRPGHRDKLALLYRDYDEENAAAFFNDVLPAVLVHVYKVAHQYERQYEGILRTHLEEQEQSLSKEVQKTLDVLKECAQRPDEHGTGSQVLTKPANERVSQDLHKERLKELERVEIQLKELAKA